MEPFVEWKSYKGIPVEIVGASEAGGSASAIKNYISNYSLINLALYFKLV